jgi:hypothetical protein
VYSSTGMHCSMACGKRWYMLVDFPVDEEAASLGYAMTCLTNLTRLHIGNPTRALVAACTPHLAPLCLKSVTLDMRGAGYQGTLDSEPLLNEFACNALHLTSLTKLSIRAYNLSSPDVASLTLLLQHVSLEEVHLALLGNRKQLVFKADLVQATPSEDKVLADLCAALRLLPLRSLSLEMDLWMPEAQGSLFKPADGGLSADPCWRKLETFMGLVTVPWIQSEAQHVHGDSLFCALSSADHLKMINLNRCHFTDEMFKV